MDNQHPYINSWAEKLQEVPLPDAAASWRQMHAILDREMPVVKKDRRWMLLLILLLLVIGICTCPPVWRGNEPLGKKENAAGKTAIVEKESEEKMEVGKQDETRTKPSGNRILITDSNNITDAPITKEKEETVTPFKEANTSSATNKHRNAKREATRLIQPRKNRNVKQQGNEKLKEEENALVTIPVNKKQQGRKRSGREMVTSTDQVKNKSAVKREFKRAIVTNNDKENLRAIDYSILWNLTPDPMKPVPGLDSVKLKADSLLKEQKRAAAKPHEKGFVAAIGLNHSFPIAGQQKTDFNSSGESGVWTDYIPVPQLRYHFNRRMYIQAEAQFNAPQYTKQLLLNQSVRDTNPFGQRLQQSVFVKKLFYFNLPLSVHVSPVKDLYVGVGIQYSRLKNAVAVFEEKPLVINRPDSLKKSKTVSLKTDTLYQLLRTDEWRLLADANYHLRRVTIGLRYNQALDQFINVRISASEVTQARNNSLQLYMRYALWDQRKRRK
jgi:hypothetical protein